METKKEKNSTWSSMKDTQQPLFYAKRLGRDWVCFQWSGILLTKECGVLSQGIGYNSFSRDSEYYFRSVLNHCWIAESPQVGVLTPLYCLASVGFQRLQAPVNSIPFPSQARECACAAKLLGLWRGGPREPISSLLILVCNLQTKLGVE